MTTLRDDKYNIIHRDAGKQRLLVKGYYSSVPDDAEKRAGKHYEITRNEDGSVEVITQILVDGRFNSSDVRLDSIIDVISSKMREAVKGTPLPKDAFNLGHSSTDWDYLMSAADRRYIRKASQTDRDNG